MSLFSSIFTSIKNPSIKEVKKDKVPGHIAIIMDGNGRWALKRGLPRSAGHKVGVESLKKVVIACIDLGVKYLTVYSFSSENWLRPKKEVDFLLDLFVFSLKKEIEELNSSGVKLKLIGQKESIPAKVLKAFRDAEKMTATNNKLIFNIAFNYGSRKELIEVIKKIHKAANNNKVDINKIDENAISDYLFTTGIPDPDLLIRTSGEYRISNFLLWQLAYTELYFTKTLWPDFREKHLHKAIQDYQKRSRRFGKI